MERLLRGPLWPEPVQVLAYQPLADGGFHIVGDP